MAEHSLSVWDVRENPLKACHVKMLSCYLLSALHRPSISSSSSRSRVGSSDFLLQNGRTVRKVEVLGLVVSIQTKQKFLQFEIDDGSGGGCVPCILWFNHMNTQSISLQLGTLLRVQGRLSLYKNNIQIKVSNFCVEKDPNAEILHWLDCIRLSLTCYDFPAPATLPSINSSNNDDGNRFPKL